MLLILQRLVSCRLTWRQAWQHAALLCMLIACMTCPSFTTGIGELATHRRLLLHHPHHASKQGYQNQLRLKLQRIVVPHKDRYDALQSALHRDQARRELLQYRRAVAGIDGSFARPNETPSGSNPISSGLHKASLNVISGSSVGSGEYFASISVGTPPQKLFLIADTGSDLTWVKCRSSRAPALLRARRGTIHTNQSFDETASSSFSPLSCLSSQCAAWFFPPTCNGLSRHCGFSYSYTDQSSIAGSLAFESIMLGESEQANVVMGCGSQYSGPNFDKAGGVVGLGQGPLSLASQLAAQSTYSNKFSYCLADFFGPSSISGSLAFGETLLQTTLRYTPLIQNPYVQTFYYVGVQAVKVGSVMLDIPADVWGIDGQGNGGTIVDSGTTLAQFAKPAYDAIRDAFRQAIRDRMPLDEGTVPGLDLCYSMNSTGARSFPGFTMVFDGGLVLEPPMENYFTEAAPGITCLAMQGVPPGSFSVVGNLLQQNFHMEFDRLHNRLGVSPADCSKLHS